MEHSKDCDNSLGFVVVEAILHLMSEWLYSQAGQIVRPDSNTWFQLLNGRLQVPTEAFCSSIERLRKFWELAPHMMEVTTININALASVVLPTLSKSAFKTEKDFNEALAKEATERVQRKYEATGSFRQATGYDLDRALSIFENFLKRTTTLDGAVRAVLESQLTLGWTAFETLTEGLWKAAASYFPDSTVGFDNPHFRSLRAIRETYKELSPTGNEINDILGNPDLRKLSLVRNVLVHKSGIVDYTFLDGAAEIGWTVKDVIDQPIKIDGLRVKELMNPVIETARALILALDKWITAKLQTEARP